MTIFENYNPLDNVKVTREDVKQQERLALNQLERKQYISIREKFFALQDQTLEYSVSDADIVFQQLTNRISEFMAYQEALFNLMRQGEIMPVNTNAYSIGETNIRIKFAERSSGCITSGQRHLNIPIFVHDYFVRTPSLR